MVILKKEETARCFWKIAKIAKLLPGKYGKIRAAEIKVMNYDSKKGVTTLRRPLQLLIPTEITSKSGTTTVDSSHGNLLNPEAEPFVPSRSRRNTAVIGELRRRERNAR